MYLFVKSRSRQHTKLNTVPPLYDVRIIDGTRACQNRRRVCCGVFPSSVKLSRESHGLDDLYLFIQSQKYVNANTVPPLYDTTLVVGKCASRDGQRWHCDGHCALGGVEVGASRILIGAAFEGMPLR